MKCPECKAANPEKAIFCMACGARLKAENAQSVRLRQLQNTAPQGLRRKMQAAREQLSGERKPVTILFTDIVGSTAIAETMDPEDWREVVAGAHRHVSEAIYKYEGTITQLLGDGVYAFFGAPITHEDDPERAVLAALELQKGIAVYRTELQGAAADLQLRVGINTGEVVIGDIGNDLHVEYLAFGDAVNLAARLETAAEPGTILVSRSTHEMISHQFETAALDPIRLKG
ncbi:MAG: adenylate/guanylate cyclase domain-containing protein, partial [Anaerolineales bacterium]